MFIEDIQVNSRSPQDFQLGKQLYVEKKVEIKSIQKFWRDEEEIKAEVVDKGNRYFVEMTIGEDAISSARCNCSREMNAYYRSRGNAECLCAHCIASALQYWQKDMSFQMKEVETSFVAQRLLAYYAIQKRSIITERDFEKAYIEPRIILDGNDTAVDFKIGREKKYIIKNIYNFTTDMEERKEVTYGKNFTFVHKRENLDDFSAQMADLIMDSVNRYRAINGSDYFNYYDTTKLRELTLNSFLADKFMHLVKNQRILVAEPLFPYVRARSDMQESYKFVKEGNPKLTLLLQKKGRDGANLQIKENFQFFRGARNIYIAMEDIIYICDESFSQDIMPLLDHIKSTSQYGELNLNEEDFPLFCMVVLPSVEKHITVETVEVELEAFKPQEKSTKFYFDMVDDEIACKVTHVYGEIEINPALNEDSYLDRNDGLVRDAFGEMLVENIIMEYFNMKDDDGNVFLKSDDEELIFDLFEKVIPSLMELGEVYISDSLKNRQIRTVPNVTIGVSLSGNLLELDIDMGDLTSKELLDILGSYRQKKKFHRLKDGSFLKLEERSLDTIDELTKGLQLSEKDLSQKTLSLPAYRAMFVDEVLEQQEQVSTYRNEEFKNLIRNMKEVRVEDFVVPEEVSSVLRHYQEDGFRWMKLLESYGFGGILADDMGLGKTIQVISLLLSAKKEGKPALIVCPASLVYNWEQEFKKFAPNMKVKTVTGTASEREALLEEYEQYDAIITSYHLLHRDIAFYKKKKFSYEIIDEAQAIKNHSTQNAKAVKSIKAEQRFALTGTPIENRLSELWSIFDYLMPGFLYNYTRFKNEFETPIVKNKDENALKRFRQMTSPFILRRLKQDVLTDLPEKTEQVRYAEMEGVQSQLYNAAALTLKQQLENASAEQFNTGKVQILAALTRLRQICCDPSLCFEGYHDGSAKMEVCGDLIENSVASGHKVLLFSQFTSMLAILEEWLKKQNIAYYKLTGETSKEMRMQLVSQFQEDEVSVFLISLKAGGTGLNLTAADTVIHYDPWWNVAAQNQATDRTHRIGQERPVTVYRIIAKGTIEERILELQEAKKDLTEQVLSGERGSLGSMTKEELLEILG